jgi:hypothetical protein
MFDFTAVLPEGLLSRAFRARNGELAWNRADAIDAITLVERAGFRVLGVEVWVPSPKGPIIPMPFFYVWDRDQAFSGKIGILSPSDFVREFRWDERDAEFKDTEPYFNVAVAAETSRPAARGN